MYTWVTHMHAHLKGACSHKCIYCYAPKGCQDRKDTYSGPVWLDLDELNVSYKGQPGEKPRVIFIDHMNDLFADDVEPHIIQKVLRHCAQYLDNTYVFQTKNPARYQEFINELQVLDRWSAGVMLGATIETNRCVDGISKAPHPMQRLISLVNLCRSTRFQPFITVEPVLDMDADVFADWLIMARPQFVNIGADSKDCNLPEPDAAKLHRLIERLQLAHIEIREKRNLKRLLRQPLPDPDNCPVCGHPWADHDFGVPAPVCPALPQAKEGQ